jgi:hypothetical protein
MFRKITAAALALVFAACPVFAFASNYDDDERFGNDDGGFSYNTSYTDTENLYVFEPEHAFSYFNKVVLDDPDYGYIEPGTEIYLPVYVNVGGTAEQDVIATDKLIKEDSVTINYKVLSGADYVGPLELMDTKKMKLKDVPAGMYVKIPLARNYDRTNAYNVHLRIKLSVNNVTYDSSEIDLKARIRNPINTIAYDSVFGAALPSLFRAVGHTGAVTFDFGNKIAYDGFVRSQQSYFLSLSREPISDISVMYPDAWLDYYAFLGNYKTFDRIGDLKIPVNRANLAKRGAAPELYVYRVSGDALTALGAGVASFDAKTNMLHIRAKTLESYVLSNKALLQQITPDMNNNILKSGYAEDAPASQAAA